MSWRSPPGRYKSLCLRRWHLREQSLTEEEVNDPSVKVYQVGRAKPELWGA